MRQVVARGARRHGVLFALLATLIGAGTAGAQAPVCLAGEPEVRGLGFSGNRAFGNGDLSQVIATMRSSLTRRTSRIFGTRRCLDRTELARDLVRLKLYYRKRGYWRAQVDSVVTPRGKNVVDVLFTVREERPIVLTSLGIAGLDSIVGRRAILAGLDTAEGGAFDEFRLGALVDSIATRLLDNGYPGAQLLTSYDVDTVAWRATYDITVDPGKLARIGDVVVVVDTSRGQRQQIRSRTVKKILGLRPGSVYRRREVVTAQRNLYATDAYRHVELGLAPGQTADDTLLVIQASLIEGDMHSAQTGIGWATLDCFRTQGTYTDRNFLGGARRVDVTARISKIGVANRSANARDDICRTAAEDTTFGRRLNYYTGATYRQPTFFGLRARAVPAFTLYSERRSEFKQYERTTPIGVLASVTREQWKRTPLTFGYQVELGRTDAADAYFCGLFRVCNAEDREQVAGELQRLSVASVSLTADRTDLPISPTRGAFGRVELRHASRAIGSDPGLQFNKGIGDASWYTPLGSRTVFATRLRAGGVLGAKLSLSNRAAGNNFIPPQERLYAGGPNTVRGFQQNELGPIVYVAKPEFVRVEEVNDTTRLFTLVPGGLAAGRDIRQKGFDFVPTGGNTLVVANAELRLRDAFFPNLLQWTLFLDGGSVWERGKGERFGQTFRVTPGLGLSILSFLGPIGVTAGYNPRARPQGRLYYNDIYAQDDNDVYLDASRVVVTSGTICLPPAGSSATLKFRGGQGWVQDGACGTHFTPAKRSSLWDKITLQFSIGQAF